MAVEIFVGKRRLEELTPEERKNLGRRIAELSVTATLAAAERAVDRERKAAAEARQA